MTRTKQRAQQQAELLRTSESIAQRQLWRHRARLPRTPAGGLISSTRYRRNRSAWAGLADAAYPDDWTRAPCYPHHATGGSSDDRAAPVRWPR